MEKTVTVKLPEELRKRLEETPAVEPKNRPWEDWEKKVVLDYYSKFGARGLMPFLPGRSAEAIGMTATRLGVRQFRGGKRK